jgi:hypothetical protein
VMISPSGAVLSIKSSMRSTKSITTDITKNRMSEKKNVVKNFLMIYESSFFKQKICAANVKNKVCEW